MLDCLEDPASDDFDEFMEWLGEPFGRQANMADLSDRFAKLARRLAKTYSP